MTERRVRLLLHVSLPARSDRFSADVIFANYRDFSSFSNTLCPHAAVVHITFCQFLDVSDSFLHH